VNSAAPVFSNLFTANEDFLVLAVVVCVVAPVAMLVVTLLTVRLKSNLSRLKLDVALGFFLSAYVEYCDAVRCVLS